MKPQPPTQCIIKVVQYGYFNQAVLCDIYFNDALLYKGIQNKNCPMPYGTYKAVVYLGEHKYERLLLQNVLGHSGVEIHEANKAPQLHGCTAIGFHIVDDMLYNSVKALQSLISKVKQYNFCFVELTHSPDLPVSFG